MKKEKGYYLRAYCGNTFISMNIVAYDDYDAEYKATISARFAKQANPKVGTWELIDSLEQRTVVEF